MMISHRERTLGFHTSAAERAEAYSRGAVRDKFFKRVRNVASLLCAGDVGAILVLHPQHDLKSIMIGAAALTFLAGTSGELLHHENNNRQNDIIDEHASATIYSQRLEQLEQDQARSQSLVNPAPNH